MSEVGTDLAAPPTSDTQLTELELPEAPVLELLNSVSMAKRMANMVR